MGKVPIFTRVFIVGILLFFGFFLLLSDTEFFGEGPSYRFVPTTRNRTTEPEITIPEGDFVGTKEVEDLRHITLSRKPFQVSYITEKKSFVDLEKVVIENGLFTTNEYQRVFSLNEDELKKLSSATLTGEVEDTNLYGRILVGLNGETIYSRYVSPGENFEVFLNRSVFQSRNELLLTAESSGWRLWAPTVYHIKNLQLKSDFTGEVSQSFDFHVKEEETPVKLARVILKFDEIKGDGKLFVSVNGEQVFNGTPNLIQWIEFENLATEGKNTVGMVSERGTEFTVRDAEVIIFWDREARENLEMTINLDTFQYRQLPGEIRFKIQKIFGTPTSLVATIENPDGERHSLVVQGVLEKDKTIEVELPEEYAGVGRNKVIFSVTGSGGYTISDFHVSL
ncbi:MAG: hypothetical protein JSV92_01010 [archaeon]|nr:MAG: hypothetical protein JSV92_01010 [archaeon]